jgi:hypothetical protein
MIGALKPKNHRLAGTLWFKFGAGIGALVLTGAGALWSVVALMFRADTAAWEYAVVALPVLALAALAVSRMVAVARHPKPELPDASKIEGARQGRRIGMLFASVLLVEAVLIAVASVLLQHFHRPLLIPVAVMAIVGVHFVPLARVFGIRTYRVTGIVLVGLAAGSLWIHDEATRVFALSLASALVLWLSAAVVVMQHVHVRSPHWTM